MAKIFVEETEINIWEKKAVENGSHVIQGNYYTMEKTERTNFKSTIFNYDDMSVLVSKVDRFGEGYIKIVLFNDTESKAWNLINLSDRLEINVHRFFADNFVVIGKSRLNSVMSQISFCKLKPSTAVEEITINFNILKEFLFIEDSSILICYEEKGEDGRTLQCLALYNYAGKLIKTFYEFYNDDDKTYSYTIKDGILNVLSGNKNKKNSNENIYILKSFAKKPNKEE